MSVKLFGILVHLSMHMWQKRYDTLPFEDEAWEYIIESAAKCGINAILLDVGDGVAFSSHPELAISGAWSRQRVHEEYTKLRARGISLIPKLNFSAAHMGWLGEYARMLSTPAYYRVAADLIHEVYELFEQPKYIHLGMDEENAKFCALNDLVCFRQRELYWHDLRFLLDRVHETGAKPWLWLDPLIDHSEEYRAHVEMDEAVLSPWYYLAMKPEHFTPCSRPNVRYLEELPEKVKLRAEMLPLIRGGYSCIPCGSVFWHNDYNMDELIEYCKDGVDDRKLLGFMTAPWVATQKENLPVFDESFRIFQAAIDKHYPERRVKGVQE